MIAENIFKCEILPHIKTAKRGFISKYDLKKYFNCICYRLKTGCQWRQLPLKEYFAPEENITWKAVYYWYMKWNKEGIFEQLWKIISERFKHIFDLDVLNLDGSHSLAKRGGEKVAYQGRKKAKTTNQLFITDRNGLIICCSQPESGNHHDIYEIKDKFSSMFENSILKYTNCSVINADSGFDSIEFRELCRKYNLIPNICENKRNNKEQISSKTLHAGLYKERFVAERSFAWLDSFKLLLVRYEVKANNWLQIHFLAMILFFYPRLVKV